jgi:carboxyl-terminal processing protease
MVIHHFVGSERTGMSSKVRSILVLGVGTVLGLTVALGVSVLSERYVRRQAAAASATSPEYLALLGEVIERVRGEYVDQVDDRQLVEGAIRGIVEELDQHSRFLDSSEYEDIRIATSGLYTGVGLDLRLREGRIVVVEPLAGAPAERAGILPGDVVISVDEVAVDASNIETTIDRMRGASGTPVTLGMMRDGEFGPLRFVLERTEIQVQTVHGSYLGDGYAYVRLSGFADSTAADLDRAAQAMRQEAGRELEGLVLDLRDNPGGVLESAVQVADLFLDDGLIVRGNGRARQARFAEYAHPGASLEHVPLAVLINSGSASASEIVAGALQDHSRGRLVGERTYGKGSVQSVLPLGGGNAIKLTTSRYLTPSGRSINETGIEPDFAIADSAPDDRIPRRSAFGDDQQLRQALRLIGYDPIKLSRAP